MTNQAVRQLREPTFERARSLLRFRTDGGPIVLTGSDARGLDLVLLSWTWWGWMFTMWLRRCPQCRHRLGRHERRRDGSFKD